MSAVVCCPVDGSCPSAQFPVVTSSESPMSSVSLSYFASTDVESCTPNFSPANPDERMNISPWLDVAQMSAVCLPYNKSDNDGGMAFVSS